MAQSYINDRTTDYHSLKSRLMGSAPSRQRSEHFDVLNRHLRPGLVTPGQLVIIPDSHSVSCSGEEAWLMRHAQEVRRHLDMNSSTGKALIGTTTCCRASWRPPPLASAAPHRPGRGT